MRTKITILSVTYYRLAFVKLWADNLLMNLENDKFDYEIFIVDNNSKDGTKEFLQEYFGSKRPETILRFNDDNLGFGKAFHSVFSEFTGDFWVHYSSDILAPAKWTSMLHKCFKENEKLGICSPFYVPNCNDPMQNAKKWMSKRGIDQQKRFLFYSGPDYPVNVADGFLMARMTALRAIGGYYVQRIYGGHDASLTKRMINAGWECAYTNLFMVEHLAPTADMQGYENWKRQSQQKLRNVGVESEFCQEKGFYD